MKRLSLLLGMLVLLLAPAYAQKSPVLNAKVPFEFVLAGKTLPAGDYTFTLNDNKLQVKNQATGSVMHALVMTTLANNPDSSVVGLTFDVADGKNFLEAVWPVAGKDGYLINIVKGKHQHKVVKPA